MKISEKVKLDRKGLEQNGPITIVALGDSVTHGAFEKDNIDYEAVYHNQLAKMIRNAHPYVPVNVINAGIGGTSAPLGVERFDSQVARHSPDLVIICFGLNDVNGNLNTYASALLSLFKKCISIGAETVFLTPNMLNTYVADDTHLPHLEYAKKTAEMQNSGKMDDFMQVAKDIAVEFNIPVADAYAVWKKLSEKTDTTLLLANRINHPSREMHKLFAKLIYEIILPSNEIPSEFNSLMFEE